MNPNRIFLFFQQQYDGFELFPVSEFDNEPSSLHGIQKTQQRHSLYQFFINNIDIIPLLMLLKNINLIYDRLKSEKFVKCPEGAATIEDLLHIFYQICSVKAKFDKKRDETMDASDNQVDPGGINASDSRPVRGAPTMNQALGVVEKMVNIFPKFYALVKDYDILLLPSLDKLGQAIATNFKAFIEFTQPEFWDRFKEVKTPKKRGRRKTSSASSRSESLLTEDEDDASSIFTEDSDG